MLNVVKQFSMTFDLNSSKTLFEEAFMNLRQTNELPEIYVEYYPYVNTNHTIRFRGNKINVRLSDTFETAPREIHRALAYILIAKLLRIKLRGNEKKSYLNFVRSDEFQKIALRRKKERGKKRLTSPQGKNYDLSLLFAELNQFYFDSELKKPDLSWSLRPTFRRLGHHDPAHEAIIISKTLDRSNVPQYVVEFVLYHEMLHIKHPAIYRNGRRYTHTPDFRHDEVSFEFFEEADRWIEENAGRFEKYAKRNR
jgi:hypothetical protein